MANPYETIKYKKHNVNSEIDFSEITNRNFLQIKEAIDLSIRKGICGSAKTIIFDKIIKEEYLRKVIYTIYDEAKRGYWWEGEIPMPQNESDVINLISFIDKITDSKRLLVPHPADTRDI